MNATDRHVVFFLTCFAISFLCSTAVFGVDITCSKQINSCSCETSDGKIVDLQPLSTGPTPRFSKQASDQFDYQWDPCREFDCSGTQVSACQVDLSGTGYIIGLKSTATFGKDGNSIKLDYTDGNLGGRTSTIHLICDPSAPTPEYTTQGQTGSNYDMTLKAKEVCPVDHGGGGGGGSSSGWSIGDVLLLIFFLSLVLYLVIGVVINIFVRKQSGTSAIPNKGFWTTLPGLIKDGGKFAVTKSKQLVSKDGGSYQEM